jgi:nucleotidyltransferase/DNA polymerase involved in DNA repair
MSSNYSSTSHKPASARDVFEGRGSVEVGTHHGGDFNTYFGHKIAKLRSKNAVVDEELDSRIFDRCYLTINGLTVPPVAELRRLIRVNGGVCEQYPTPQVTHVVTNSLTEAQIQLMLKTKNTRLADRKLYVTVAWVLESIAKKVRLPECDFPPLGLPQATSVKVSNYFSVKPTANTNPDINSSGDNADEKGHDEAVRDTDEATADDRHTVAEEVQQQSFYPNDPATLPRQQQELAVLNPFDFQNESDMFDVDMVDGLQSPALNSTNVTSPRAGTSSASSSSSYYGLSLDEYTTDKVPNFLKQFFSRSRLHFIGVWRSRLSTVAMKAKALRIPAASGANIVTSAGTSSSSVNIDGRPPRQSGPTKGTEMRCQKSDMDEEDDEEGDDEELGYHRDITLNQEITSGMNFHSTTGIANMERASLKPRRVVLHIDLDCFFVSALTRDKSELQHRPVAVAHSASAGSSEVSSCNYHARKYGLKNGMFMRSAKELCPDLVVLGYDFKLYEQLAEIFYLICFSCGAARVEPVSVDECYVEFTVAQDAHFDAKAKAEDIRARIYRETGGCTASVGIGHSMLVARLATKRAKPNGVFEYESNQPITTSEIASSDNHRHVSNMSRSHGGDDEDEDDAMFGGMILTQQHRLDSPVERMAGGVNASRTASNTYGCAIPSEYLRELSLRELPGVGWNLAHKLEERNMRVCADVWPHSVQSLTSWFGTSNGFLLHGYSRGIDDRQLTTVQPPKSVGCDINWGIRFHEFDKAVEFFANDVIGEVSERLQQTFRKRKCVTIKLKQRAPDASRITSKFLGCGLCLEASKSVTLPHGFMYDAATVASVAVPLFKKMLSTFPVEDLRGLGLHVSKLEPASQLGNSVGSSGSGTENSIKSMFAGTSKATASPRKPAVSDNVSAASKRDEIIVVLDDEEGGTPKSPGLRNILESSDFTFSQKEFLGALPSDIRAEAVQQLQLKQHPSTEDPLVSTKPATAGSKRTATQAAGSRPAKSSKTAVSGKKTSKQQSSAKKAPAPVAAANDGGSGSGKLAKQQITLTQRGYVKSETGEDVTVIDDGDDIDTNHDVETSSALYISDSTVDDEWSRSSIDSFSTGIPNRPYIGTGIRKVSTAGKRGFCNTTNSKKSNNNKRKFDDGFHSFEYIAHCSEGQRGEDDVLFVGEAVQLTDIPLEKVVNIIRTSNMFVRKNVVTINREIRELLYSSAGIEPSHPLGPQLPGEELISYLIAYGLWMIDTDQLDIFVVFMKYLRRIIDAIVERTDEASRSPRDKPAAVTDYSCEADWMQLSQVGGSMSLLTYVRQNSLNASKPINPVMSPKPSSPNIHSPQSIPVSANSYFTGYDKIDAKTAWGLTGIIVDNATQTFLHVKFSGINVQV